MSIFGDIKMLLKLRSLIEWIKRRYKMAVLPDKPPKNSFTMWGSAVIAIGTVLVLIGMVQAGEIGWSTAFARMQSEEVLGAIVALAGWFVRVLGQRKIQGETVRLLKDMNGEKRGG
ncbi:MAG: hypothetical protein GF355_04170 [Candidatus Eisenbacteria bacterium]|nr:hypothetical protein [Candidatus Eisenbacteria bacterium]